MKLCVAFTMISILSLDIVDCFTLYWNMVREPQARAACYYRPCSLMAVSCKLDKVYCGQSEGQA